MPTLVRHLWHSMSSVGRFDVIVLVLMLVYLFAVVTHVYYRYRLARRFPRIDSADSKKLVVVLNIKVGSLKSIALTAPCLGLAGTCFGIWSAFGGVGMEEYYAARAMIVTRIALALIPTAVAIPVTILATASYNYLSTRIDLLASEVFEGHERGRYFPKARRFPPTERFTELAAVGLLVTLGVIVLVKVFMPVMPATPFQPPTGFYVELASVRCEHDGNDRVIVLHMSNAGKVFLNREQEEWTNLADRLSAIYGTRQNRTLYLFADNGVPFQSLADALGILEKLGIKVRLVTPRMSDAGCILKPVMTGSTTNSEANRISPD